MDDLHLSENEYSLVCLVLEEPPMPRTELVRLTARRLFLEPGEADTLVTELLSRDVLASEDGCIRCRVSREEADLSAIRRALNTFTPRWPAPNPPPAEPLPESTPAETPAPKKRGRLRGWIAALLLCAAAVGGVWFFLLRDRYPQLTTFEDGRTFSLLVKPESDAQKAAAAYLEHYAETHAWFGAPIFRSLELADMTEFTTDGAWATQVETYDSYAEFTSYDVAAEHQGVVIFAEVEVSFTDDAPALSEDGACLYRLYLSETDGIWTVDSMKETAKTDDFFVDSEEVTADGHTLTVSQWGRNLTGGGCQIYAVTVFDGEQHRLLYLTEEPVQQSTAPSLTLYDLNADGYQDLMFFGNYRLCYLYSPEEASFRLSSLLSGHWLQYDPALPGTVQFSRSVEGTTTQYLYRIADGDTLEELARLDIAASPSDGGSDLFFVYIYHEFGELTETRSLAATATDLTDTFDYTMTYLEPWLLWDESILRTAQQAGCLELPAPQSLSSGAETGGIQFLMGDYESNLFLYTSPNGFLLLRDGTELFVLPGSPDLLHLSDYDGDGDRDIFTALIAVGLPIIFRSDSGDWNAEPLDLDLSAIVEDFVQNTAVTFITVSVSPDIAILHYSGAYGEAECSFGSLSPIPKSNPSVYITPGQCTASTLESGEASAASGGFLLSFPVYLTASDPVQLTGITYTVTLSFLPEGGWTVTSVSLTQ